MRRTVKRSTKVVVVVVFCVLLDFHQRTSWYAYFKSSWESDRKAKLNVASVAFMYTSTEHS